MNQLDILLPVGKSFYTFQVLSYTIDVYRRTVKTEHNFIRYSLYVSFSQLVAGPIERSGSFLKHINNIEKLKVWNYKRVTEGFILMLWGYFQIMVIADRASIFVNTVFDNYNIPGKHDDKIEGRWNEKYKLWLINKQEYKRRLEKLLNEK